MSLFPFYKTTVGNTFLKWILTAIHLCMMNEIMYILINEFFLAVIAHESEKGVVAESTPAVAIQAVNSFCRRVEQ